MLEIDEMGFQLLRSGDGVGGVGVMVKMVCEEVVEVRSLCDRVMVIVLVLWRICCG